MMDERPPDITMVLPEHLVGGVLADFVNIAHNSDYFTLDFAVVTGPPAPRPEGPPTLSAHAVARVKILPGRQSRS